MHKNTTIWTVICSICHNEIEFNDSDLVYIRKFESERYYIRCSNCGRVDIADKVNRIINE